MKAIIKRHKYILQHNTVLKELFPMNSFIVAKKSKKPSRVGCTCRRVMILISRKYLLYVLLQELTLRFAEIALVIQKILYT